MLVATETWRSAFQQRGSMLPEQYDRAKAGWGSFFDRIAERLASG